VNDEKVVLDGADMRRTLVRIAHEIVEKQIEPRELAIVGIHRRGAILARRLRTLLDELLGTEVPLGDVDISFYRDDLSRRADAPVVNASHVDFDVDGRTIVVVDDVLYTGRTVRAALDELADFGRPKRIALAVLIDRGGRELPIQPDVVGKTLEVAPNERVDVLVTELDERDAVVLAGAGAT
jgi:pyrimidine operon attenuation protein / uracil phosphoribosyltransferase